VGGLVLVRTGALAASSSSARRVRSMVVEAAPSIIRSVIACGALEPNMTPRLSMIFVTSKPLCTLPSSIGHRYKTCWSSLSQASLSAKLCF
jgi:hypothetical protein